ncbi:MAG: hypothetical protein ACFFB7_01435 [Candidatus Sifarchaeia archaeon]
MNDRGHVTRISLIASSVCLLLTTLGQLYISLIGNYGSDLFATLDNISSAFFMVWLITLILYVSRKNER